MDHKNPKSLRQILSLIFSISQNQADQQEVQWVRREIHAFFLRVITLGFYS